ncbi:hypothetical protein FOZ63_023717 [Perkinsus olseni]|uniref:Solute carrier 38 member n=1 Tax=Perkinsus olseni TaxID=32597 RepID=A0A7J6TIE4_PEROL|nr:hypothetical protein FOZ63_023717 [Perkinsus olseni]
MSGVGHAVAADEVHKHLSHTTAGSDTSFHGSNAPSTTAQTPLLSGKEHQQQQVPVSPKIKQSSLGVTIANLMKNIIGAGLLSLPRSFALTV